MKVERKCRARQSSTTKARSLSVQALSSDAEGSFRPTGALSSDDSINGRFAAPHIRGVSGPAYMPKFEPDLSISNRELLGLEHAATY